VFRFRFFRSIHLFAHVFVDITGYFGFFTAYWICCVICLGWIDCFRPRMAHKNKASLYTSCKSCGAAHVLLINTVLIDIACVWPNKKKNARTFIIHELSELIKFLFDHSGEMIFTNKNITK
ncbi:hypothetical protein D915_002300, partial [Fasciola hepatica]